MALDNKDLFLVSQATTTGIATTYAEKKVKWSTIKSDLGIRNAKQETDSVVGIPGMMFPDNSFDYNELSGRLSVPLDARGVKFVDLLDDDNKDQYPDGTEDAGDFYIVDQADLEVSSAKWKGISDVDVVADPSQQSIDIAGQGYSPNNGVATVLTLTEAGRTEVDFGPIECLIENGKIIQATHLPTPDDLSTLDLETRLFTINVNNSFSFEKAGILECKNVTVDADGNYVMLLSVVSQGEGHRLFTSEAGSFTGALASPQTGEATSFPIDIDIDEDGKVTAITAVALNSGHENGDMFNIVMPYGSSPVVTATFELVITGDAVQVVQINDKLIKRTSGDWAILVDQLATQAILTIKNLEEGGVDKTPALKIEREVVGDPRFLTLEIETVTSDQPGLMPPDLYDLLLSYPDTVAGGTIYNILIDDEASIDQLSDLSYYSGPEINPLEVVDIVRYVEEGDPNSGEINTEEQKDVKISVGPATVFDTGGGEVRVRGTVYIATKAELISEFAASSIAISGDYDRAINSKIAGEHLMPRNLKNLAERTEEYRTAKRLKITTTSYEVATAGLATLSSTLTYEDGTEVPDADSTSYTYLWQGIEYNGGQYGDAKDLGTAATQLVDGGDFSGPTNITCTVNETTDSEFQTLSESIYLHFSDAPIIPPTPPSIGGIRIVGQSPVYVGDVETYTVALENPIGDEVIAGTVDQEFATNEGNVVTFTKAGMCLMTATVTSETAVPGTKSTSREIEVLEPVPLPPVLGDVVIVGPPTIMDGTQSYSYDYSGTAQVDTVTWSITNVNGDDSDFSIDQDGLLTADDSGVVTIQVELGTSVGTVSDTLDVTVVAGPSGNEVWDNDPDETYRIHVIITKGGNMSVPKYGITDLLNQLWEHYKIYNMKTNAWVNNTGTERTTIKVSTGDEFMYIITKPGKRLTYNNPTSAGPVISIGPKSFTAAHDGDYSNLFTYTQVSDASLLDVSNATNIDGMFANSYVTPECRIDFTGAKITSAIETFANNNSGNGDNLPPYIGMGTMDMSECVSVKGFLYNTVFATTSNGPVTLDWDLSKCEDMSTMLDRFKATDNTKLVFGPKVAPSVGNVTNFHRFAANSNKFSQNLSDWCVSSVQPGTDAVKDAFGYSSMASNTAYHPKWGTCPGQSF